MYVYVTMNSQEVVKEAVFVAHVTPRRRRITLGYTLNPGPLTPDQKIKMSPRNAIPCAQQESTYFPVSKGQPTRLRLSLRPSRAKDFPE